MPRTRMPTIAACDAVTNLSSVSSPHSANTSLADTGTFRGPGCLCYFPRLFYVTVPPGHRVEIGITKQSGPGGEFFDTEHAVMWGDACPTVFATTDAGHCTDDPDSERVKRSNSGKVPRKLWFVVGGTSKEDKGSFTLTWAVHGPCRF